MWCLKRQDLLQGTHVVESDIGRVHALSGNKIEAERLIAELKQECAHTFINPYVIALIYMGHGQKDRALEWLEKAFHERSDMLVYLKVCLRLDALGSDPPFAYLVRRMNLQP